MPKNSVIVGMTTFPIDMSEDENRTKMFLPAGDVELTYFLTVAESAQLEPITQTEADEGQEWGIVTAGIIFTIVGVIAAIAIKKRNKPKTEKLTQAIQEPEKQFDLESTLSDDGVREDDKEIIKFIHENGGEALESELRKKFLQPRTTMWRAVKRLERQGKIEISKKDQQNLVKLKNQETKDE